MKTVLLLLAGSIVLSSMFYATLLSANDTRKVSEFEIVISFDRGADSIELACSEGCAWVTASIPCGPDSPCSAEINSRGTVTPARSK